MIKKIFWGTLNLVLLAGLGAAGFFLFQTYQGFSANGPDPLLVPQGGASAGAPAEPEHHPSAIRFRFKDSGILEGEAILVPPGENARFTLRPEIALPQGASDGVRSFISASLRLEEEAEIVWQSASKGTLLSHGEGRYDYAPPPDGGAVTLRFRATLDRSNLERHPFTLAGETEVRFLFPTPIEKIPEADLKTIGGYPTIGAKSQLAPYRDYYRPPTHFYRVDEENQHWFLSPNFKLGDFDLHFDYTPADAPRVNQLPQYIALDPKLVLKLERILAGVREQGFPAKTLGILAGFRSPAYNQWKKTQPGGGEFTSGVSRHLYGCAADFYVDVDGDGQMDDMNGDGKIDMADAAWIRDNVVDAVDCQAIDEMPGMKGACGIYPEHDIPYGPVQTPNLHVDIRGWTGGPDLSRWDVTGGNELRTLWSHWEKNPCPEDAGEEVVQP